MSKEIALLIAQALLNKAGSRLKLEACQSVGSDFYTFRVAGRRGLSGKVVMPVVDTPQGMAILSLLDQRPGKRHTWLINGQANVGFKQLAHYGHSGQVVCLHSKAELALQYGAGAVDDPKWSETTRSIIANAPDAPTLVVYDEEGERSEIEMPTELEARVLCRALKGEPQYVDVKEERFRSLVKTFGLRLYFGTGELAGLIGNADSALAA